MRALSTFRDLAGGRIPPLTRTALLCGLGIFLLTLLVFRPSAGGVAPAPRLVGGVRLVPRGDVRTEQVVLLDPSAVYFPGRIGTFDSDQSVAGQPEDAPFPKTAPLLQFDPGKALDRESTLQVPFARAPSAAQAIPLAASEPYATFGSQGLRGGAASPRVAFYEVTWLSGGKKTNINGNITQNEIKTGVFNNINNENAPFSDVYEVILGVDSLGRAFLGAPLRSSGDKGLDQAISGWAGRVDWVRRLPPGSYRLRVGP
jgi:hypothetical protein